MSLRTTLLSGFLWRSLGASGQRLLSFVVLVLLARLLSVQEFGTAATASMIVLLLFPITRFGVYDYLIQKEAIDDVTRTAALMVSAMFGLSLFVLIFATAPVVAGLLADEELTPALRLLSTIFLFAPVGTVQEAILAKQFKFKTITACQIASLVPSGIVGVGLALLGFGTLSIVLQQVTVVLLTSLMTWIAAPWRPKFAGSAQMIPSMLKMGTSYTSGQLLNSINTNLFGLAVAAVGGTDAAGLFRIAWAGFTLCMHLTMLTTAAVVQPIFASLRNEPERLRRSFLNVLRYFAVLSFGTFAFVGAAAPDLISLSFGDRWREAGMPLSIMALFIFAGAPNHLIRAYLGAIGRPNQATALFVGETLLSFALVVPLVSLGMNGAAAAVVLRSYALLPMTLYMMKRYAHIGGGAAFRAMAVPFVASCALAAIVYAVGVQDAVALPLLVSLGLSGLFGALVFVGSIWLIDRSLVTELVGVAGGMLRRRL